MIYTATVSSRGQITIPLSIRKHLDLKKSQKIVFILEDDQTASLKKADDFWDLAGSVNNNGMEYSDDMAQQAIEKHLVDKYASD